MAEVILKSIYRFSKDTLIICVRIKLLISYLEIAIVVERQEKVFQDGVQDVGLVDETAF